MKEKSKHHELDALFNACLEGELNEEEAAKLSQLIEGSSEARERYWQLASVHGLVEQSMQNASLKAATGQEYVAPVKTGGFFRWPKVASVAAGLERAGARIGSTSLVAREVRAERYEVEARVVSRIRRMGKGRCRSSCRRTPDRPAVRHGEGPRREE